MRGIVGMGLLWGGYAVGFYGFCLLAGYGVTLWQLVSPANRWTSLHGITPAQNGYYTWPPGPASSSNLLPAGEGAGPAQVGADGSVG